MSIEMVGKRKPNVPLLLIFHIANMTRIIFPQNLPPFPAVKRRSHVLRMLNLTIFRRKDQSEAAENRDIDGLENTRSKMAVLDGTYC